MNFCRGYRTWIQRGDRQAKPVIKLRLNLGEDSFPGFQALIVNLSDVDAIPSTWRAALARAIHRPDVPEFEIVDAANDDEA